MFILALAEKAPDATSLVMPKLDELIPAAIAFVVFFLIMAKIAYPALRKGLSAREAAIKGDLEKAEQARLDAEELKEEYRRQLADARAQADRVIKEAQAAAEEVRKEQVAKAEAEARGIVEKARAEAAGELERAMTQLRSQISDLALQGAQRVVEKELSDPAAQRQLVDQFLAQVSSMGSQN